MPKHRGNPSPSRHSPDPGNPNVLKKIKFARDNNLKIMNNSIVSSEDLLEVSKRLNKKKISAFNVLKSCKRGRGPEAPIAAEMEGDGRPVVETWIAPSEGESDAVFRILVENAAAGAAGGVESASPDEAQLLGGPLAIGRNLAMPDDLLRAVETGFRPTAIQALLEAGLERTEIERLVAPMRTLQRRKAEGRLSPAESDAALRLARILAQAEATLGGRNRALSWLRRPNHRFGDRAPISLLGTEAGGRQVEDLLIRADHGIVA